MRGHARRILGISTLLALLAVTSVNSAASAAAGPSASPAAAAPTPPDADAATSALPVWRWPLDAARDVIAPYRAPAHDYGAGHRGIDLAATPGTSVLAPEDGVVAFRGTVVDRPLITLEHPGGLVSTFEPVTSTLSPGDRVTRGDVIAAVALGGHAAPGTVHFGVRLEGAYINPLLLFGEVPRAVLLPCCAPM